MNYELMSDAELDKLAAEKIMGWWQSGTGWMGSNEGEQNSYKSFDWHPTTDRNQSRQVVEATIKIMCSGFEIGEHLFGYTLKLHDFCQITPRQEVIACLMALDARSEQ